MGAVLGAHAQAKKEKIDIANLIVELAVQYSRAANTSVLAKGADAKSGKAKGDAVTQSFFGFAQESRRVRAGSRPPLR